MGNMPPSVSLRTRRPFNPKCWPGLKLPTIHYSPNFRRIPDVKAVGGRVALLRVFDHIVNAGIPGRVGVWLVEEALQTAITNRGFGRPLKALRSTAVPPAIVTD